MTSARAWRVVPAVLVLSAAAGCRSAPARADRPSSWAQPMDARPGLENFFKVSDDLYRGAQPSDEGLEELKKLGIKTVIEFRPYHSGREDAEEAGLGYVRIRMATWDPDDKHLIRFLRLVTDKSRTPIFVHCSQGADRTGLVCAIYRMAILGWSREEAIREMTEGGFGYHPFWDELVDYVRKIDIDRLKRLAGLAS